MSLCILKKKALFKGKGKKSIIQKKGKKKHHSFFLKRGEEGDAALQNKTLASTRHNEKQKNESTNREVTCHFAYSS